MEFPSNEVGFRWNSPKIWWISGDFRSNNGGILVKWRSFWWFWEGEMLEKKVAWNGPGTSMVCRFALSPPGTAPNPLPNHQNELHFINVPQLFYLQSPGNNSKWGEIHLILVGFRWNSPKMRWVLGEIHLKLNGFQVISGESHLIWCGIWVKFT